MVDNVFASLKIGQRITATHTFTAREIQATADLLGDDNFLHHDPTRAAETRFGGLIASGGHTAGVMGAVVASHFSGESLGLELSCRMRGAVRSGDTLTIEWEIIELEYKARWQGGIVTLQGQATNQQDEIVMTGQTKALVSPFAVTGLPSEGSGAGTQVDNPG